MIDLNNKTPEQILELSTNYSDNDLKTNYRKLMIKWHPDKNKDPQAEEYAKKINWAYGVLTGKIKERNAPTVQRQQQPNVWTTYTAPVNWTVNVDFNKANAWQDFQQKVNQAFQQQQNINNQYQQARQQPQQGKPWW